MNLQLKREDFDTIIKEFYNQAVIAKEELSTEELKGFIKACEVFDMVVKGYKKVNGE